MVHSLQATLIRWGRSVKNFFNQTSSQASVSLGVNTGNIEESVDRADASAPKAVTEKSLYMSSLAQPESSKSTVNDPQQAAKRAFLARLERILKLRHAATSQEDHTEEPEARIDAEKKSRSQP